MLSSQGLTDNRRGDRAATGKSRLPAIHWINERIDQLMVFHTLDKSEAQISPTKDIRQQFSQ